jgi:hypothetical protein
VKDQVTSVIVGLIPTFMTGCGLNDVGLISNRTFSLSFGFFSVGFHEYTPPSNVVV